MGICCVVKSNFLHHVFGYFRKSLELNDPLGVCARLTFNNIEYVVGYGGGYYAFRFTVNEGNPPRVFDANFLVANARGRAIEHIHVNQVTRYKKYEVCAPVGVVADVCVCDTQSASRDT